MIDEINGGITEVRWAEGSCRFMCMRELSVYLRWLLLVLLFDIHAQKCNLTESIVWVKKDIDFSKEACCKICPSTFDLAKDFKPEAPFN